ncbi:MAG: hypothetical protein JSV51_03115 [Candidatus Bathyarchaeota archaeon]|nr:MAG: hypothetical protein JSV51_03115 [Candidatus Bathyarchaeota archaeon]
MPNEKLQELLECIRKNPRVVIPPAPGYDSGVHVINENECLVISTDPCIGVPEEWFGWLLVNYAASDVALFGAKPEFCTITLLGPPKTKAKFFTKIMKQACSAVDELNMTIVTGHTGAYDGLSTLVGVCTAYGAVSKDKLITPGGSQEGDCIIFTKQIGLETVVNFVFAQRSLAERIFNSIRVFKLQNFIDKQTCVSEALLLAKIGGVHAMHDATEGGLVAALNEMADSSNLGFTIDLETLPILEEAQILRKHFSLSQRELLSISSTGTLLAAVNPKRKDLVLQKLRKHGVEASSIGVFTHSKKRLIQYKKKKKIFPKIAHDPYSKIMLLP